MTAADKNPAVEAGILEELDMDTFRPDPFELAAALNSDPHLAEHGHARMRIGAPESSRD